MFCICNQFILLVSTYNTDIDYFFIYRCQISRMYFSRYIADSRLGTFFINGLLLNCSLNHCNISSIICE